MLSGFSDIAQPYWGLLKINRNMSENIDTERKNFYNTNEQMFITKKSARPKSIHHFF